MRELIIRLLRLDTRYVLRGTRTAEEIAAEFWELGDEIYRSYPCPSSTVVFNDAAS